MRDVQLNDMQQYLVEEFLEEYQEGHLSRRQALRQLTLIVGSGAVAAAMLAACGAPAAAPTTTPAPPKAPVDPTKPAAAATTAPAAGATKPAEAAKPTEPAKPAEATKPAAAAASPTGAAATKPTEAAKPAAEAKPTPNPITIPENDPAITGAGMIEIDGPGGKIKGYLARPAGTTPRPGVIVIHENRGLTPHIQDVTRRAAKAGYVAFGIDLLSRAGGTEKFTDPQQASGAIGQVKPEEAVADLKAVITYLQSQATVQKDKIGVFGFCWGGGQTWRIVTQAPEIKAAVPFYGPAPAADQVKNIKAAVLGIYAGNDERINAGIPDLEKALKEANITYQMKIYPNVAHAFHNDTGTNYNAEAARDAWGQVQDWFKKYLA